MQTLRTEDGLAIAKLSPEIVQSIMDCAYGGNKINTINNKKVLIITKDTMMGKGSNIELYLWAGSYIEL